MFPNNLIYFRFVAHSPRTQLSWSLRHTLLDGVPIARPMLPNTFMLYAIGYVHLLFNRIIPVTVVFFRNRINRNDSQRNFLMEIYRKIYVPSPMLYCRYAKWEWIRFKGLQKGRHSISPIVLPWLDFVIHVVPFTRIELYIWYKTEQSRSGKRRSQCFDIVLMRSMFSWKIKKKKYGTLYFF